MVNGLRIQFRKNVRVFFNKQKNILIFKGPLGLSMLDIPSSLILKKKRAELVLTLVSNNQRPLLFTFSSLIHQKMLGVSQGFFVFLDIKGIGWQVSLEGRVLVFKLGFTNLIHYELPNYIEAIVLSKQRLKIFGLDLALVEHVVSVLCKLRKVDLYKGKGVLRQGQELKLKVSSKFK